MGRKHSGKRRNCSLRAISPVPTVFSKDLYCRHIITRACLGKGSGLMHLQRITIQVSLCSLGSTFSMPMNQSTPYDSFSTVVNPFPNDKFLDLSKLEEFSDPNFKFDENYSKFSKSEETTVGK